MRRSSRMRLGTEEDLDRIFGPGRLLIGVPVRPRVEDEQDEVVRDTPER